MYKLKLQINLWIYVKTFKAMYLNIDRAELYFILMWVKKIKTQSIFLLEMISNTYLNNSV